MSNHSHDDLERAIDVVLRGLSARRAPHTLEQRVLAAIERRAAQPWWRASFAQWPLLVRALFVVVAIVIGTLTVNAIAWLQADHVPNAAASLSAWTQSGAGLFANLTHTGASLLRLVPSTWIFTGLVVAATLYVALFGLGAVAYRILRTET